MRLTQAELSKATNYLNEHAVHISGDNLSFFVHYWGGEQVHYDNVLHKHSFFEVCYVLGGEGTYWEAGNEYSLHHGVIFLSRPHIPHRILSSNGISIIFVAFELVEHDSAEDAAERFLQLAKTKTFYLAQADETPTAHLWKAVYAQAPQYGSLMEEKLPLLCHTLILSFEQLFSDVKEPNQYRPVHSVSTTIVHQAKLYIRDNLSQPLRLNDVANYLHISGRHLSRLFAEELGQTFSSYVRKERVRQAALLLSTTNLTIKTISDKTGFTSVHYFTSVFKSEVGVTPGRFYKELQNND